MRDIAGSECHELKVLPKHLLPCMARRLYSPPFHTRMKRHACQLRVADEMVVRQMLQVLHLEL
jgi:hypothetical protein